MRVLLAYIACFFCVFFIGCSNIEVSKVVDDVEIDFNLETNELAYTYFDLSNGEATLIQSGKGGNVLIGTGDHSSQIELAKRLHMYHVNELDTLILTSNKNEYIANTNWILKNYHVKKLVVPISLKSELEKKLPNETVTVVEGWKTGMKEEVLPGLEIETLFASEDTNIGDDIGLVLSLQYGEHRTLYMGIDNFNIEQRLLDSYMLKSAVLKVGEFGSPLATSEEFLKEVDPQVAILFKKLGHNPDTSVLERLQETWIDVYQTFQLGSISIKCTPNNYEILMLHSGKQEFSVALSKNNY